MNTITGAITDPAKLLALPFVIFRASADFGLAMFQQSVDFATSIFRIVV